ncbi:MAG: class I SAM-dependent methyltransferase [Anaerolineales bacterium]|nr:class I SAM-dependent methyltransferase [Anaerolineales bacterium]
MALSLEKQDHYRELYRARTPGWRPATERYETVIRDHLRPGLRVLDVGCGRGGVLEQLGELVDYPVGVDPDLASLREHRLATLPRAAALSDALPFAPESFDMILASWVLEHLDDPLRTLNTIRRTLTPGGLFIFLTPNARSLVALLNRLFRPFQTILVPRLYGRAEADTFPVRYRANTKSALQHWAGRAGLQCERLFFIADPSYLAFTPFLYRVSHALAQFTPPVHIVGVFRREAA